MPDRLVVRTYLEMRSPNALRRAGTPDPQVTIAAAEPCPVTLYRELYDRVGRDYHWRDRLAWTDAQIEAQLAQPEVAVWVMRDGTELLGFFELVRHPDGSIEIAYFGLVPEAVGHGRGKLLLTRAVEEAWRAGPTRVWLHTCTLDNPAALPNYIARGFSPYKTETYSASV